MAMRVATTPITIRPPRRARASAVYEMPHPTRLGAPAVSIAGGEVHLTDTARVRALVADAVAYRAPMPLAVASINLDHIHHRHEMPVWDPEGPRWLNLIDGAPIARQAARMTGTAWPRLAGSDLVGEILTDAAARHWRVAIVGGTADVAPALRRRLAETWPDLVLAGHWTPTRAQVTNPALARAVADEVRAAAADLVIVCLGKPRQEQWIAENGVATGAGVLLAFGAVVDFLAGRVSRSPRWVSDAGLEWMWRLMLEPRRLARRYLLEGPPAYVAVRRSSARHRT